jgi:hypothetical protein
MTLKVVGAGFGRTGTLSLKNALEQLGFSKCYHMMEVRMNPSHVELWRALGRGEPVDLEALFEGYQASVDWPSCNFWREQLEAFPEARVILSLRDPERWYESVMNTIYPSSAAARASGDPAAQPFAALAFELIWDGLFDGRMDDKDHVIGVFEAHNRHVIDSVPADRLLVFEASQGWEPLCEFLDVTVPDEPYPKVNTTEDFRAMVRARSAAAGSGEAG